MTDKIKFYRIDIDIQIVPDGEWFTAISSVLFMKEDEARDWCEEFEYGHLPQGCDVRAVLVRLNSEREVIEDENL